MLNIGRKLKTEKKSFIAKKLQPILFCAVFEYGALYDR